MSSNRKMPFHDFLKLKILSRQTCTEEMGSIKMSMLLNLVLANA